MSTKVIFRKDPDETVFALFPEEPADYHGRYCLCYQHIGQHGPASYLSCIADSKPATYNEYADLLAELEQIGYNDLEICKRRTSQMQDEFWRRLREYRKEG